MKRKENLFKTLLKAGMIATGTTFAGLSVLAYFKKPDSVFDNAPEEKNMFEGKNVEFIKDDNDPINADGVRGHLEITGDSERKVSVYEQYIKRGLDIILSGGGLIALAPLYATIALAIKVDDPGPVLFTQKRVGKNKQYFKLHKFRSMKMSTPHNVPTHMLDNPDQYITKVGRFIRVHSLDELPQIWDIFIGNMSVIGPRPGLWNQDVLTSERDKYGANNIKPGLTGWAQINGRDELSLEEKAKLDGEYVRRESLLFDAKCFFETIKKIRCDNSVVEGGPNTINKLCEKQNIIVEPTFSVLMSVYKKDDPEYLKTALKSIYDDQSIKPDEIVIVFDGPLTDELIKVLSDFKEGKENIVKYFPQEVNKGLGEALRIGSEKCNCDYIFRMDSDDISAPLRFEKQIKYIKNHPDVDVLGTDIAEFNESISEEMRIRSCPAKHDDIVRMGKTRNPMNHVSVCIKKSALIKAGGYKTLLLLEDYFLWLRMIGVGCKLENLTEPLVYVRVGNGFDTKRGSKERITGWKVLQDYMVEHNMITKFHAAKNMAYINAFVKTPNWLKKGIYDLLLRKRQGD